MSKINVAILCGGKSVEHQISLLSAQSIASNLDRKKYNVEIIGVTKKGVFVAGKNIIQNKLDPKLIKLNPIAKKITFDFKKINNRYFDVIFPIIHGTTGEDGNIQGFLTILDIPFIGSNTKSSAICMDKVWTKIIAKSYGINCGEFISILKSDPFPKYKSLSQKLGLNLFVKPANLGSSVGIRVCNNSNSLKEALSNIFKLDNKALIEKRNIGREIEIGILEEDNKLIVSSPAEIIPKTGFYSYEAKYLEKDGAKLIVPAIITKEQLSNLKLIAKNIYKITECHGMARIDFFLTSDGFIFNEINTIPGFTNISMYPQMFLHSGISYESLLTKLINNALN